MDLYAALRDAQKRLARAEKKMAELKQQVEDLRMEEQGLEIAIRRHHGPGPVGQDSNAWRDLPRTEATEKMLAEAGQPLTPLELSARLTQVGRSKDSPQYVSAALSHLKKKGRVQSLGDGRWAIADISEVSTPPESSPPLVGEWRKPITYEIEDDGGF